MCMVMIRVVTCHSVYAAGKTRHKKGREKHQNVDVEPGIRRGCGSICQLLVLCVYLGQL